MGILIAIIVAGVLIGLFAGAVVKPTKRDSADVARATKVTYPPRSVHTGILDDEVMEIYISGLSHHCFKSDVGPFSGVVFNEKDNPADKEAMAIGCHRRTKILGYVPAQVLDEYRKWCKGKKRACVGYIYWDGQYLRGRCRIYPSDKEADMEKFSEDATKYTTIVAEHFGWELNEDCSLK